MAANSPQSPSAAEKDNSDLSKNSSRLKKIKEIELEVKQSTNLSICEVICSNSPLGEQQASFMSYYEVEGRRAFDDPEFRIQLKALNLLTQLFTPNAIELLSEIERTNFHSLTKTEKLKFTLYVELKVLPEIYAFARKSKEMGNQYNQVRILKKLRQQCDQKNRDDIKATCHATGIADII